METFAGKIRELRLQKGDPLRKVAAFLDIDQAILSKIENGKRTALRENVLRLEEYYGLAHGTLLVQWLSDRIVFEMGEEDLAIEAISLAEMKIGYRSAVPVTKEHVIKKLKEFLINHDKVKRAWLFGSFARDEQEPESDVDLLVQVPEKKSLSLFDLSEIRFQLEELIQLKVDVVMKSAIKPEILKRITPELILIHEK